MRSLVVILAVLGVLLCPYDCAVRAALGKAMTGKDAPRACCAKCCASPPASEQHSPRPDDPRKDGHSCLCEGAVFTSDSHQDLDWLLMSSQVSLDLAGLPSLENDFSIGTIVPNASPPLQPSGMQMRIAIRSFLI